MSTVAILAGGKATRMGVAKCRELRDQSGFLLDRTIVLLRSCFDEILLVTASPVEWGIPGVTMVCDRISGCGPMGGVHAALECCSDPHLVVVACDMPRLNRDLLVFLRDQDPAWELVIPRTSIGVEPLCARYAASLRAYMEELLQKRRNSILELLNLDRVLYLDEAVLRSLDPQLEFKTNLNTQHDAIVNNFWIGS